MSNNNAIFPFMKSIPIPYLIIDNPLILVNDESKMAYFNQKRSKTK